MNEWFEKQDRHKIDRCLNGHWRASCFRGTMEYGASNVDKNNAVRELKKLIERRCGEIASAGISKIPE